MARSPLTLAALATAAVPGLEVAGVARLGSTHGAADSAVMLGAAGEYFVIRVPTDAAAETEQSADLLALGALTGGIRSRLPFAVATCVGQTGVEGTRAIVTRFIEGGTTPVSSLTAELAASIGAAIAAVHSLPTSCVTEVGLPSLGPVHAHQTASTTIERAGATGLLPESLKQRWDGALQDDQLWQFQPAVINGSLSAESVLSDGSAVTGILGWHGLRVADPALDLAWLFSGRRSAAADAALATYIGARPSADRQLAQRASLYAELELAKWLLHGTATRDTEIVDDAVELLHGLVDDLHDDHVNPISADTAPILAVGDVEALLDHVEKVS